jgi:hypothetical protein
MGVKRITKDTKFGDIINLKEDGLPVKPESSESPQPSQISESIPQNVME